jgi:hypothetical protein
VFILKKVKVLCFDALLEVLILKVVKVTPISYFAGVDSKWVNDGIGEGESTQTGTVLGAIGGHGSLQKS